MPDPLWSKLLFILLLILLHGLFTAAETAIEALPDSRLHKLCDEGDGAAQRLLALQQTPERYRAAIRIIITLSNILAAVLAADSFAPRLTVWLSKTSWAEALTPRALPAISLGLITLILAYVSLLLGELLPRRIALKKTESAARALAGAVAAVTAVLRPVSWLLTHSTNGVLRLMRIDPNADEEDVSEDEIRMMVDLGEERGAIEHNEKELIENIFEFNNTTAEDVMIHRTDMVLIWADDTDQEIMDVIRSSGLSRFPVYEEDADDIIGILSTREYLLNARGSNPKSTRELLRPAYFVPESVCTDVLFRDMQNKKVHMAIVVDEYGGTSGLVTMEDLLEEIVGNIYDEFDPQEEKEIEKLGDNLWRIAGSCELEQVAEALDMEFPEDEESDTLGGLVFAQLSVIPEDGSQLEVDTCGLHIQVQNFNERRVEWALVSKLPETAENSEGEEK